MTRRRHTDWTECLLRAKTVDCETKEHRNACRAPSNVPVNLLAEVAGHHLTDQRADVDSHIEDRESSVATRTPFGIQIANDRGDVRLEEPGSKDDENQSGKEWNL